MRISFFPFLIFIVLFFYPVHSYAQCPEVLAWEPDIRKFEHLDSTENHSMESILFVGSSSIRLWSSLAQDIAPYPVIQRGYGGAKLSDLTYYAERIIYPHPCKAIVMFVANDITGKEEDKSPEEVARFFREVLGTIRKKFTDTPVFWIATTPTALRWDVWPGIAEANKRIQDICDTEENTHFIRTDYAFLDASGQPKPELFMDDRLHLNAQGYAVWTEIIKKALDGVLNRQLQQQ